MTPEQIQSLKAKDSDGLLTYEYIANNIGECDADLPELIDILRQIDLSGQFTASAARFLNAIDADRYADAVRALVAATIDHDRERAYLGDLIENIYGSDYAEHAEELSATDNNFRRMYKRLFPQSII
ncbi:MAG: hypothetical protein ACI30O_00225 [Muribaculaceae bacterium]